jgi:molybdenum cofactor biosynthesis enzyme MoaA
MVNAPEFDSLDTMDSSQWLAEIKRQAWPTECSRCQQTESINQTSIRLNAVDFDQQQSRDDYLIVGGVLDNVCNSACQTCNAGYSTRIGSLSGREFPVVDNSAKFWSLPLDRVVHLDLNGGEPSYSKNYKKILANLPESIRSVRLNTNCSTVLTELAPLVERGVDVTVTVSFDGMESVHDYIRWPIAWETFYRNLLEYTQMPVKLNLWTTVNAFNVGTIDSMIGFAHTHGIDHSWALLNHPAELNIEYQNQYTLNAKTQHKGIQQCLAIKENNQAELDAYIAHQDQLRGIRVVDYL